MNLQQDQKANIIIRNAYMQAMFLKPLFVSAKLSKTRLSYRQYEKHFDGVFTKEQIFERVREIVENLINVHFTGFTFRLEYYHNRRKGKKM